jgi:protein-tyrosine phosphatase
MGQTGEYFDIHSHILPGVDDGSPDMETTLLMLRQAMEQNIHTMIATPHYIAGKENTSVTELMRIRDQVQDEAQKINDKFRLLLGNELLYSESIVDALKKGDALTLAGSRYVLVEFGFTEEYRNIYKGMGNLVNAGYIPILAHIERYRCLRRKIDLLEELIELGCCLQMNSNSLLGNMFTDAAYNRQLVYRRLIHFIGSDCHDNKVRVPVMKAVAEIFRKKNNVELIDLLLRDNPSKIIENSYL